MRVVVTQYDGVDRTSALPLAAGCLVSAARTDPALAGARFDIAVAREPLDAAVAHIGAADVLGLSLYPWNATYSLAVAAAARRANPELRIVAGGSTVPRRPEAARRFLDDHPALDALVLSEGELAFREVLKRDRLDGIGGVATRAGFTAPERQLDLDTLPSPYLDGTFDELVDRHRAHFWIAVCETNRGCPFSCTFCDWSLTKHVVEFPLARVQAELEWIARRGFGHLLITDANFGIRPRDTEIARHLAELRLATGKPRSLHFYLTKNNHRRNLETIEILQGAGIGCCLGLAVQDFDEHVLDEVKRDNIQTGESMKLREICAERDIPTHNELILGLPGQTYESFTETVALAMPPYPQHEFVVFLCRLIENTEMADAATRERHGLVTRRCLWKSAETSWDPVIDEYQEVVVGTRDLPVAEWARTYRFVAIAGAAYNLRLLREVLTALGPRQRDWLRAVADATVTAAPGTVLAEIGAALDGYVESTLGGGPFALPVAGAPAAGRVEAADAVAIVALRRRDDFFAELEALSPPDLAGAFRRQRLITPAWGRAEPVDDGRMRFTPPPYVRVPDSTTFALTHIASVRARASTGDLAPIPRLAVFAG
jgi:radical SAM superfamily enzyme YgiQ (UPF0313 family)